MLAPCAAALLAVAGLGGAPIAHGSPPAARDSRPTLTPALGARSLIAPVRALLGGIPQAGAVLGYPHAPVTMQVFSDLECPYCKELALGAQSSLIRRYVRTGKLKIEFRSLETATREPLTFRAQQAAALAAGRQNKAWYFVELFYREQGPEGSGYVTPAYLRNIARQVPGLNLSAWNAARASPVLTATLDRDEQDAIQRRLRGTPSVLIGRTGGHLSQLVSPSLESASPFEAAINRLLRSRR